MKKTALFFFFSILFLLPKQGEAQINEDKLGAWYMYFFSATFKNSAFGVQGDVQYRNWNLGGDLEQLLLRGGLTYKPKEVNVKLTLGYGNVTTGSFGSSNATSNESRIYQEVLFPVQFGERIHTNHRFRYEQRFVDNQDFRTRFRYNLFLNVPINHKGMLDKTVYLALYNELFINGERSIGNGKTVELFDRNRLYLGMGYIVNKKLRFQVGFMNQTTDTWSKNQLQLSIHHTI